MMTETRIEKQRRELAQRLLESHEGHPDNAIEGAFRDLLEAANREVISRAGFGRERTKVIPIGVLKVLIEQWGLEHVDTLTYAANACILTKGDPPPLPSALRVVK